MVNKIMDLLGNVATCAKGDRSLVLAIGNTFQISPDGKMIDLAAKEREDMDI